MRRPTSTLILQRGVYKKNSPNPGPFGLVEGQTRYDALYQNSIWLNQFGEVIGQGDLSASDITEIEHDVPDGEAFLVLESHFNPLSEINLNSTGVLRLASITQIPIQLVEQYGACMIKKGEIQSDAFLAWNKKQAI